MRIEKQLPRIVGKTKKYKNGATSMNTSRSVGSRGQSRDRTTGRMGQVKPIVDEGRVWKKTGPLVLAQSRAIA